MRNAKFQIGLEFGTRLFQFGFVQIRCCGEPIEEKAIRFYCETNFYFRGAWVPGNKDKRGNILTGNDPPTCKLGAEQLFGREYLAQFNGIGLEDDFVFDGNESQIDTEEEKEKRNETEYIKCPRAFHFMPRCEVPRTEKTSAGGDARERKQKNAIASGSRIGSGVERGVEVNLFVGRSNGGHEQIVTCQKIRCGMCVRALLKIVTVPSRISVGIRFARLTPDKCLVINGPTTKATQSQKNARCGL